MFPVYSWIPENTRWEITSMQPMKINITAFPQHLLMINWKIGFSDVDSYIDNVYVVRGGEVI